MAPHYAQGEAILKLGYFAMPMHPLGRTWAETLQEDRRAVILADSLGFHDAFIGEHLTDRYENITNSLLFLATLIPETSQIKLATGTTNLSHSHPVLVALNSAMFDHLSEGRFILGISPGALPSDAEILGILGEDRNKIFVEAIDVIVEIWKRDPPYDILLEDNRFQVTTAKTLDLEMGIGIAQQPLQRPRPEIVGTVVEPFSKGVIAMGARDFHPLSANFLLPAWLPSHWQNYVVGKESVGQEALATDWRVARTIFVGEDAKQAPNYVKINPSSPYRFYYTQMLKKMTKLGRLKLFKSSSDQPDSEITVDYLLDRLVICGDPGQVAGEIIALRDEVGDFGELVYAGMDWVDEKLGVHSMELMANEVMPAVNKVIGGKG